MTNATLKNLTPGATYKAHPAAKAQVYVDQLQQAPLTAVASGAADATGNLTLNLPDRQEYLVQGPDGYARKVLNATTKGWPS